jgi:dTDP-4-dehydrorhamnose 3,5-epimerase
MGRQVCCSYSPFESALVKFTEAPLKGAFVTESERQIDNRGFFARTFCVDEFAAHGLSAPVSQASLSYNEKMGTLRGMHFQAAPYNETKLVRCTAGAIYDVIVDLRSESETFLRWFAVELSAENHMSLFIPEGFAHGFQTLRDRSEVHYQISPAYHRDSSRGFAWNDERIAIDWPIQVTAISDRDAALPSVTDILV